MTPYETNVNSLFTALVDSASISNFNTFKIYSPGTSQSDAVYGLFQCRGDLSSSGCKECVMSSISQLKTTCPMSLGGTIQLDECFVKYDNTSFFGVEDKTEAKSRCDSSIGSNSDVSNNINGVLQKLVSRNDQYFRSGNFGSIQGVAQCVQDLSLSDCQDCLLEASGRLRSECGSSRWGDMYLGKCHIQYADNGKDQTNSNNCCNQNDGGVKRTIIRWLIRIMIVIGNAFVSFVFSKYFGKEAERKADEANRNAIHKSTEAIQKAEEVEKALKKALDPIAKIKQNPCPCPCPCPYRYPYC